MRLKKKIKKLSDGVGFKITEKSVKLNKSIIEFGEGLKNEND